METHKCLGPKDWIDYTTVVASSAVAKAKAKGRKRNRNGEYTAEVPGVVLPQVITHDERLCGIDALAGQEQQEVAAKQKEEALWTPLPWRTWKTSQLGLDLDAESADVAAAVQVLRALHRTFAEHPPAIEAFSWKSEACPGYSRVWHRRVGASTLRSEVCEAAHRQPQSSARPHHGHAEVHDTRASQDILRYARVQGAR